MFTTKELSVALAKGFLALSANMVDCVGGGLCKDSFPSLGEATPLKIRD